jgi:hypothetical protein
MTYRLRMCLKRSSLTVTYALVPSFCTSKAQLESNRRSYP